MKRLQIPEKVCVQKNLRTRKNFAYTRLRNFIKKLLLEKRKENMYTKQPRFKSQLSKKFKSVSKRVVQCHSLPAIPRNMLKSLVNVLSPRVCPFSKMAVKWSDLKCPSRSPKFNFHHLRKVSAGFKMVVSTLKSGVCWYYIMLVC